MLVQQRGRSFALDIRIFLHVAIPMMLSFMTEPIMQFFDRIFLSHYKTGMGEYYLSASLNGGLFSFIFLSFFISIAGYSNPLVAQHYGASKEKDCGNIAMQSIIFALAMIPFFGLAIFFVDDVFKLFNHDAEMLVLEVTYSKILLIGGVFNVLRSGISGFFIGIGRTKVVLFASLIGMFINIPLNYVFIYGVGPVPEMGISGAALATISSTTIALSILLINFFSKHIHEKFYTRISMKLDVFFMKKLLKYGAPTGIETMTGVGVFGVFIASMSSFGPVVGASTSIAINWDAMFFIPMAGLGFAATSLIGQSMGRSDFNAVYRFLFITLLFMGLFAIIIIYFFIFHTQLLINLFIEKTENRQEVLDIATWMLRLASIYLGMDALSLAIGSLLRGAGDTKALMFIYLVIDVLFFSAVVYFILGGRVAYTTAWWIFIAFPASLSIGTLFRLLQGKWKAMSLVGS